jgi:laminin, gamma 1
VRLKFHSSRPESFAIYKRNTGAQAAVDDEIVSSGEGEVIDDGWRPYQFYSSSCEQTYGMQSNPPITPQNEASAHCRDDFSDISPLTGASVAFSTLEGRPGAYDFENNLALQVKV